MPQPDVEAESRERDDGKVPDEKSGDDSQCGCHDDKVAPPRRGLLHARDGFCTNFVGDDADVLALLISVDSSRWHR
jgi:hypothetical protein